MKIKTKDLTRTAILLAILLAVQLFKNFSPYISGPIVNAVLILATMLVGLWSGVLLSVIAPVTAFLITGAPIYAATNFTLFPIIMIGNLIIVFAAYLFKNKNKISLIFGLAIGSVVKWLFIWLSTQHIIIPFFIDPAKAPIIQKIGAMFMGSLQLSTALIGSLVAYLVFFPLKKALK